MHETIRQTRQDKGMGIAQLADLMDMTRLELLSVESEEINGFLDESTRLKALRFLGDPSLEVEPIDIEDGAVHAAMWKLGIAGQLENDEVKQELKNRLNAGQL